jgi:MOSC domain-containing protein YiiM
MDQEPGEDLKALMHRFPRTGRLEWIGLRPRYRAALDAVDTADAIHDHGLMGDHGASRPGGKRQVTLIQSEHLVAVAQLIGQETVDPAYLRRNLVVSGINLLALRDREFCIGEVVLLGTGPCAPCSRMEEALGVGGFNAMRGHGGITAKIIRGGALRVGDSVSA